MKMSPEIRLSITALEANGWREDTGSACHEQGYRCFVRGDEYIMERVKNFFSNN